MEFWVLGYRKKEGNFYDFKLKENEVYLKESCLLPTEEMANEFLDNHLSDDYVVLKVTITSYASEGSKMGYLLQRLPEWCKG